VAPEQFGPGKTTTGIRYVMDPEWHIYWKNPGDSGTAPKFVFNSKGAEVGPIQWPAPARLPVGDLVNLGYEESVILPFEVTTSAGEKNVNIEVQLEWLVCSKSECIPGFGTLTANRPVGADEKWKESDISEVRKNMLRVPQVSAASPWKITNYKLIEDSLVVTVSGTGDKSKLDIFPTDGISLRPQVPTKEVKGSDILYTFKLQPGVAIDKTGFVLSDGEKSWEWSDLQVGPVKPGSAKIDFTNGSYTENAGSLFIYIGRACHLYGVGRYFLGTSLCGSRRRMGISIAISAGGIGIDCFILVDVSVCPAGPFMGTALGAAATLPAMESLAIFVFLGLGLASPFIFVAAIPPLQKVIPRPGPWMEKLKQFFAFPLIATVIWLLWVLHLQIGVDEIPLSLGVLLLLSFALWIGKNYPNTKYLLWVLSAVILIYVGVEFNKKSREVSVVAAYSDLWQPFTPARIEEARSLGKPVVIDFTAAWCITCQFNKDCPFVKKHYNSGNMQKLQKEFTGKGVAWLTVLSSAKGKEGYTDGPEALKVASEKNSAATALILDPTGTIGKAYGAKTTPHMFVINPEGKIIYAGGIDNNVSSDPKVIPTSKNYVAEALTEGMAGKPVLVSTSRPYGCSVKYQ
jgi:hypothetical protein